MTRRWIDLFAFILAVTIMTPTSRARANKNRNAVPAAIGSGTSPERRVSDLGLSDLGSDPRPAESLEREPAGRGAIHSPA